MGSQDKHKDYVTKRFETLYNEMAFGCTKFNDYYSLLPRN